MKNRALFMSQSDAKDLTCRFSELVNIARNKNSTASLNNRRSSSRYDEVFMSTISLCEAETNKSFLANFANSIKTSQK